MAKQQSSFSVLIRGLVMLSSLIVFPYLALTGHSLPDGLTRLIPSEVKSLGERLMPHSATSAKAEFSSEPAPAFGLTPKLETPTAMIQVDEHQAGYENRGLNEPWTPTNDLQNDVPDSVYTRQMVASPLPGLTDIAADQDLGAIEERLKSLGAVAYHLEEWGSDDNLYRFVCELAVSDQQNCRRHFEAIESTPLLAMRRVLAGVECRSEFR